MTIRRKNDRLSWTLSKWARVILFGVALVFRFDAQQSKADAERAFDAYIRAHESEITMRRFFLLEEFASKNKPDERIRNGKPYVELAPNEKDPHPVMGGQIHHWRGAVFLPGVTADRVLQMLKDYDHRKDYFRPYVLDSKLNCRTGENRFGFSMTLKEHATFDTYNEVVWERVDDHHWRSRSSATRIQEAGTEDGKDHGYLWRLNSYWRFVDTPTGTYVEGENVSLSGDIGTTKRLLGQTFGISPKASLEHALEKISNTLSHHSDQAFAPPARGLPQCADRP